MAGPGQADVAQLAEQRSPTPQVPGSTPGGRAASIPHRPPGGHRGPAHVHRHPRRPVRRPGRALGPLHHRRRAGHARGRAPLQVHHRGPGRRRQAAQGQGLRHHRGEVWPRSADLGTFLGADVDTARATYLLAQATTLCQSIVSPCRPARTPWCSTSRRARTPTRPTSAARTSAPTRPATARWAGGLWLTRQNKSTLRRLNGGSSAFSIDPVDPDAVATATAALPYWGWDPTA
jgi:hypothetical protein